MSFKPPKEFGEPSPFGLSQIRALNLTDAPFLKSITPGVRAYKRGQFKEVWNEPPQVASIGLSIAAGRFDSVPSEAVIVAGLGPLISDRRAFRPTPVRYVPDGDRFGVASPLLRMAANARYVTWEFPASDIPLDPPTTGFYRPMKISFSASVDLKTMAREYEVAFTNALAVSSSRFVAPRGPAVAHATRSREERGYNVAVSNLFDLAALSVLPKLYVRSDDATWEEIDCPVPYPLYDNWCVEPSPVTAGRYIAPFMALPRGANYLFNPADATTDDGRPRSPPSAPIPYPWFADIVDGEAVLLDLDYLFAGLNGFAPPTTTIHGDAANIDNGLTTAQTIRVRALASNDIYLSFVAFPPGGPAELRVHRGESLESLSRVADIPVAAAGAGYSLARTFPAYANSAKRRIGYHCLSNVGTDDSVLFSSIDGGLTWDNIYVPWPSSATANVFELDRQRIAVVVYAEGDEPGLTDAYLLASDDFGAEWSFVATVAKSLTQGFGEILPVLNDEPLPVTAGPMAPWVFDGRLRAPEL